jgi:hypothetical protein
MASTGLPRTQALIPGAREQDTSTYRQSGAMGGPAFGSGTVQPGYTSMSAATIADREKEGGGAASQRRRTASVQPDENAPQRWRRWRQTYAHSGAGARRARVVFAVVLTVLAVWLGLQLMSWRFWA